MKEHLKVKKLNKSKALFKVHSKTELKDEWKKSAVVSIGQVKRLMRTFKAMGIKDDSTLLIFEDPFRSLNFREVGSQHDFLFLTDIANKDALSKAFWASVNSKPVCKLCGFHSSTVDEYGLCNVCGGDSQ